MKKSVVKIFAIAIIGIVVRSSTVFAAQGDIYDLSDSSNIVLKYTQSQIATSTKKQHQVMNAPSTYGYEAANGKIYTLEQINDVVNDIYSKNPSIDDSTLIDEAFVYVQKNLTPVTDSNNSTIDFDVDTID